MRSIRMPSLSHQTLSLESPKSALPEAQGVPLSVRMAPGEPVVLEHSLEDGEGELVAPNRLPGRSTMNDNHYCPPAGAGGSG